MNRIRKNTWSVKLLARHSWTMFDKKTNKRYCTKQRPSRYVKIFWIVAEMASSHQPRNVNEGSRALAKSCYRNLRELSAEDLLECHSCVRRIVYFSYLFAFYCLYFLLRKYSQPMAQKMFSYFQSVTNASFGFLTVFRYDVNFCSSMHAWNVSGHD